MGLLDGIRVLEMSHVMAAPACGLMLADLGADVIKVERLPEGDGVRNSAPYVDGESAPFAMMNRNKRGLAIDTRDPKAMAMFKQLLMKADVFIENYRQGAMEHFGIGYEQIKNDCPRLIYTSITGYGRTGPYAERGGFDLVAQGMSGLMSITGEGPGRPPVKVGAPVTDITAGSLACMGVLGALYARSQTGKGQLVDTSLFEAGIMHTYWQSAIHMASGEIPGAMGSAHPLMAPYQAFKTKDGWINIGAANQGLWTKLAGLLGAAHLADDPRFKTGNDRIKNLGALVEAITPFFEKKTTQDWFDELDAVGIPAGPVLDIQQMTTDPQTLARGMVQDIGSSKGSSLRVIGHPVKYSEAPTSIRRGAPSCGEHSREILLEVASAAEVDALIASGAAGAPQAKAKA